MDDAERELSPVPPHPSSGMYKLLRHSGWAGILLALCLRVAAGVGLDSLQHQEWVPITAFAAGLVGVACLSLAFIWRYAAIRRWPH